MRRDRPPVARVLIETFAGSGVGTEMVRRKELLTALVPSVAITVSWAVPDWPGVGFKTKRRFVPDPVKTILLVGIRISLEEVARTVIFVAGVSTSLTVNA